MLLFLLMSCATTGTDLLKRGVPKSERQFFIDSNGSSPRYAQTYDFIEGKLDTGFTKQMVFLMYGQPDVKPFGNDSVWQYDDSKGAPVLTITFNEDTVTSF